MLSERIQRLREESIAAQPSISSERAELITEFYQKPETGRQSIPLQRAMAFRYILENKALCINDGELIVGERGPAPKATPTYPEICTHSLKDLEILDSREKVSFSVSDEVKKVYQEKIIPFWKGLSMRERIFSEMTQEWLKAYKAGIFTEFQEQRAPGHTVNGDKIYKKGFLAIKREIEENRAKLDFSGDPEAYAKKQELEAMAIAADALILYAGRYADALREKAQNETNQERKKELEQMAEICECVPANPPRNFWEALQYYWFVHLGVITEFNTWDSFNPGRLDQHLYPFYEKGLADGSLTEEYAKELFIKQVLQELIHLWKNKTRHGANRQKFGIYQEQILNQLTRVLVPSGIWPKKYAPLRVDSKFNTYAKVITWNRLKALGKRITREKPLRTGQVSLSEYDYLAKS